MDLEYNKKQLPSEIAALLPDSVEEFTGDDADARVLAVREPGGPWRGGILQVNQDFAERDVRWQNMILLHELAHLLTSGRPGAAKDHPARDTTNHHDSYWLRIFALLMARSGYDIRDFRDEVDYLVSQGLSSQDIDAAMADAGMPWPKINDDVWMQRIVDIADERVADARRGWRRQAWAGWAVLAGLLAGVLAMGTFVVAAGAR
ncbi:MAG: hypothetical protein IPH39_17960 [Sulfuritalea sp.]|jgi:hypothetical protein|nr:hypothetical protein [Sulfuritalea sp.]MBK9351777.1 hypothetical protein [Sulfuritalea sp.]